MAFTKKSVLMVAAASFLGACVGVRYQGEVSDHFDGTRFFSPYGQKPKGFFDLLRWQLSGGREAWPTHVENRATPQLAAQVADGETVVSFVNHATLLVQTPEANFLTDPVWSERVSPVSFAGPKRIRPPGVRWEELPKIHYVLISHNHYDHLDLPTVTKLAKDHDPLFVVPLGDGRLLEGLEGVRFREMDWWQEFITPEGARIRFLPAQHWSARGPFDRNASLWGSFRIDGRGASVYFGGDTGFSPHFREIAERTGPVELALLPIGAYEPRWFMRDQHMNPEEAVQAHRELRAGVSIGMHFGTWQLTDEGLERPVEALLRARAEQGLAETDFQVLSEGETRTYRRRGDSKTR